MTLRSGARHPGTGRDPAAVHDGMEIARLYGEMWRRFQPRRQAISGSAVTPRMLSYLRHLAAAGPLTVGEQADHLGISRATATEVVNRLESKGLVERMRDQRDQRRVFVWLTERGREQIDALAGRTSTTRSCAPWPRSRRPLEPRSSTVSAPSCAPPTRAITTSTRRRFHEHGSELPELRDAADVSFQNALPAENAVGWRIWLCAFARIGPSFSLSARAEIQAQCFMKAFHFFSRSASNSQANRYVSSWLEVTDQRRPEAGLLDAVLLPIFSVWSENRLSSAGSLPGTVR